MDRKGLVARTADGTVSEAEKVDAIRAFAMPAIAMFMLFALVMSSAPQLLNSVIEEKTSRISEVLLGSVSAFHLMLGKLLGSVAVTLVLGVVYIGGGLLLAAQADYFGLIRWSLIPWFGLFLVIAVFLYGAMFIAIGAACSEVKDAQGMMMPALVLSMFPIFVWLQVAQNPDSAMSVGFSLFPFSAPYLMLLRIAIPPGPPAWQVIVAVLGSIATTARDGLRRRPDPARRPADAGQDRQLPRDGALDHREVAGIRRVGYRVPGAGCRYRLRVAGHGSRVPGHGFRSRVRARVPGHGSRVAAGTLCRCPLWRLRLPLFVLPCFLLVAAPALAQSAIEYTVSVPAPEQRWLQVDVVFPAQPGRPLDVRMARSSPGRYATHEFGKNVYMLEARAADGDRAAGRDGGAGALARPGRGRQSCTSATGCLPITSTGHTRPSTARTPT